MSSAELTRTPTVEHLQTTASETIPWLIEISEILPKFHSFFFFIKTLEHEYIFSEYSWNLIKNIILPIFRSVVLNYLNKAGLTLNYLYDTTCMIQLVWLCKIANSYKFDVQIFVWYNFWKIGWVLFLPTCMKEINQSHFTFRNAELFWRKSSLMNGT